MGIADICKLGFRKKGYQCTELVSAIRNSVERCTEWDLPLYICQLYVALAFDSVRREAVWRRGG